jgi:hypothetical protein
MNDAKEVVEQKQGQPWKVEKTCEEFATADSVRKNLLANSKDGLQAKVKFLPSIGKFVVKSRNPQEAVVEQKTNKKSKKQTPTT